jgi:pyrimidine-nucleoside phosphorylase
LTMMMMPKTLCPTALLEAKKQGQTHSQEDINQLVQGVLEGAIADYQLAAWLMAVCLKGLSVEETIYLTQAFVSTGTTLNLDALDAPAVDKHSTGGVGDKTTLVVVPLLAAAGVKVCKLSGRGLGLTGGTIDKLEAIAGFQTRHSEAELMAQVSGPVGAILSSATTTLAPADSLFYALRDVTATVDNLSLIAASVMSKKIAAGAQTIVLDIKVGQGAFMKTLAEAEALANLCVRIAQHFGKRVETVISNMEEPLGKAIGHSLEVHEAMETLQGRGPKDLEYLCLSLACMGLVGAGLYPNVAAAWEPTQALLHNGEAFAKFKALVLAQGGDEELFGHEPHLCMTDADRCSLVVAPSAGVVQAINANALAQALQLMGGARKQKTDALHLGVGFVLHKKVGDAVEEGDTLMAVHASTSCFNEALALAKSAFTIAPPPLQHPIALVLHSSLPLPAYVAAAGR